MRPSSHLSSNHRRLPKFISLCLLTLTVASLSAHADWVGTGELGAVSARGNTRTDTANAKLDIHNELEWWKHEFYATSLYGANNSVTAANRWETRWQSDYKITDPLFWYGGLRYEHDSFGAFSYQETATTGLGYKFIDNDTTKLTGQAGVGLKRSQEQTVLEDSAGKVIDRIDGDTANRGLVSAGVNFEHVLTPTTKIIDKLLVEAASDNTFMQNDLSLQVAINEKFSLSAGYGLRQNTSPPSGSGRTDSITTLNLVYNLR